MDKQKERQLEVDVFWALDAARDAEKAAANALAAAESAVTAAKAATMAAQAAMVAANSVVGCVSFALERIDQQP